MCCSVKKIIYIKQVNPLKKNWIPYVFYIWRSPERWSQNSPKQKTRFSMSGRFGRQGVLIWQCNNKLEKHWNLTESKRKLGKPLYFDLKHPLLKPSTDWETRVFFLDFFRYWDHLCGERYIQKNEHRRLECEGKNRQGNLNGKQN